MAEKEYIERESILDVNWHIGFVPNILMIWKNGFRDCCAMSRVDC